MFLEEALQALPRLWRCPSAQHQLHGWPRGTLRPSAEGAWVTPVPRRSTLERLRGGWAWGEF